MTLDDVMKLEGRELDKRVGARLGLWNEPEEGETSHWWGWADAEKTWNVHASVALGRLWGPSQWSDCLPKFSSEWQAAMLIPAWLRGQEPDARANFATNLAYFSSRRRGEELWISSPFNRLTDAVVYAEAVDYARAILPLFS